MTRLVAVLLFVLMPRSVASPDDDGIGQWVFPRTRDVPLRDGDKTIGKWSVGAGTVLGVSDERLLIRHSQATGPRQGWVLKTEIVKLADAPEFFSDKIRADGRD